MNNSKNTSLIATVVATILCGCPGLLGLCWGLTTVFAGFAPNSQIDIGGSSEPRAAIMAGLLSLCVSVIFIAIPIVTWFVTRRQETARPATDEPIPPAS